MSKPTQEQIERLPKWAQDHIRRLERKVQDSERAITDLQQDQRTPIYWTPGHREDKKYIPDNARIYFELPDANHALMLHWDRRLDMLIVAAEYSALLVRPHSSNWIHVYAE